MINSTAYVDAADLLDAYRARHDDSVRCLYSFGVYHESVGSQVYRAGTMFSADHPVVQRYPERFSLPVPPRPHPWDPVIEAILQRRRP